MKLYPTMTILLFALLSFLAALCVLLLPETKGRCLPSTIEEIEDWGRYAEVKVHEDIIIDAFLPDPEEEGGKDKEGKVPEEGGGKKKKENKKN